MRLMQHRQAMHSDHFENDDSFIKWLTRNLYFFPGFTPITSLSFWTAINNSLAMGVKGGRSCYAITYFDIFVCLQGQQHSKQYSVPKFTR